MAEPPQPRLAQECRWDLAALGEVMLRLDPGDGRIATARSFRVWEVAASTTSRAASAATGPRCGAPLPVQAAERDQGMTAAPTQAMAAAARGEPFRIPFGGGTQLHYGADVARAFVDAARRSPAGAEVYNLGGPVVSVPEVVAAIEAAVPGARIANDNVSLPFASRLPEPWFQMPETPLAVGVAETVEIYGREPEQPAAVE